MANQSPLQTRKLVAYVASIVGGLAVIFLVNRALAPPGTVSSGNNDAALFHALERLYATPDTLSMTMQPGPKTERVLRHTEVPLLPHVDVLVIGQSDADHMSAKFFREGIEFHNGFLSNSIFAYQFEVFEEIVAAHGLPSIVLYDVRSGYLLHAGQEPAYNSPAAVFELWDGPLYSQGNTSSHWYSGLDSMLSLQQTEESFRILGARYRTQGVVDQGDAMNDSPFHVVPQTRASSSYRWLADGSRVYPGELNAVLAPRGQAHLEEALQEQHLNEGRMEMLGNYLDRYRAAGATVIVYTPPVSTRVYTEAPRYLDTLRTLDAPLRAVVERWGYDYCNLSTETLTLGCTPGDFYDEVHLSRACNRRIVARLASGCAKRFGPALRAKLVPEIALDHP
jgi:hypothetical protein